MTDNNIERGFFITLLLVVTLAFFWLIRGFMQPIFWAAALGIVVYPLHALLVRRLRNRRSLAAGISVVVVVIVVILPLIGIGAAVTAEGAALYQRLNEGGGLGVDNLSSRVQQNMPRITAFIERVGLDPERIEDQVQSVAVTASRLVAERAVAIGQGTVRGTLFFFLMLYLLFFFLRDGPRILEGLIRALPLGDERERHLLGRFAEVSRATIKGTLVIGIVQGTMGGLAFALLGIGSPVLWGTVMALVSLLPAVGTALVWLPAAIYLVVTGHIPAGALMILFGVLISLTDNILRPILVGRDTRLPDYLVLLATLGGIAGFGLAGIILGPTIAALFLSVWHMAEREFSAAPADEAADPPPPES